MKSILLILQIVFGILLIGSILVQNAKGGLGTAFGGGGSEFRTKRGMEVVLFRATILFAVLFFLASIANLVF